MSILCSVPLYGIQSPATKFQMLFEHITLDRCDYLEELKYTPFFIRNHFIRNLYVEGRNS